MIDVIDSVRFCLTSRWPKNAEALISIVRAFISSFVFTRVHRLCHSNHKTENLPTLSWLCRYCFILVFKVRPHETCALLNCLHELAKANTSFWWTSVSILHQSSSGSAGKGRPEVSAAATPSWPLLLFSGGSSTITSCLLSTDTSILPPLNGFPATKRPRFVLAMW